MQVHVDIKYIVIYTIWPIRLYIYYSINGKVKHYVQI